jgi:hypothetical protein
MRSIGLFSASTSPQNPVTPRSRAISAIRCMSRVPIPLPCHASRTTNATSARFVRGSTS